MAIVTFPPGSPGINTSKGGATFTRNSSGSIIRARRKPLLKRTPNTTQSRTNFRHVTSNFRNNSPAEKTAWASKTPQFLRTNSLGIVYELSNLQLYQALNNARVNEYLSINFTASDAASFPARTIDSSILDVDPIDLSLSLNDNTVPANFNFRFYCTIVEFTARAWKFPEDYILIQSFSPGVYGSFDLSTFYQQIIGPGPSITPGNPKDWFISTVLQSFYSPSGETSVLDTFVSSINQ